MSILLVATDEAGYGPKLGPLVIVGTAWQVPEYPNDQVTDQPVNHPTLVDLFAPLRRPAVCGNLEVIVDDSKTIFKQSKGIDSLHAVVSAAAHWCGVRDNNFFNWFSIIARQDLASVQQMLWSRLETDRKLLDRSDTEWMRSQWSSTGVRLCEIRTRIITAKEFNACCRLGANKADLLSQSTLDVVRQLIDTSDSDRSRVTVFCDRHGGRRYYAGVLQHVFPDAQLQVVAETKQQSRYRLNAGTRTIEIAFTVKGDSFTPVALSSMIAKYLRERMMESLNAYFAQLHTGNTPLKPTAGYPVDADRFLQDIQPIIQANKINPSDLIRSR